MKQLFKKWMHRLAPGYAATFFAARSRAHSHRIVREWGSKELNDGLIQRFGRQVLSGPFKGMTLTSETEKELLGPYLLGTFESEIHPWIEQAISRQFTTYVDVGAKFGFYSVGFALNAKSARSIAFDIDPWARKAMQEMAKANSVINLDIRTFCSWDWIVKSLPPNSFVLSDCEGYESVLFQDVSESLRSATLLIETHDHEVPGLRQPSENDLV